MRAFFSTVAATLARFIVVLALATVIVPHFLDRRYVDRAWPHMVDGRFVNPDEGEGEWTGDPTRAAKQGVAGPLGFLARMLTAGDARRPWPETVAVTPTPRATLAALPPGAMRATWVGHATVLVETPGFNFLTDPIWSDRAGPFGIGPRRVARPGIAISDLPRIDAIVVSHNHYDHMDIATLRTLWRRDRPQIFVAPGNDAILRGAGVMATALPWGESWRSTPICAARTVCAAWSVTATRNHHWSSRWGADRNRAHWASFLIDTPSGPVFFAGDTGPGDMRWPGEAARAARSSGGAAIRLAILPIGAFRFTDGQMWSGSHIGPGQAVDVARQLGAIQALPVHWGTFRLSWEAIDTPPAMLALERACRGVAPETFPVRGIGEAFGVPEKPTRPVPARCDQEAIATLR